MISLDQPYRVIPVGRKPLFICRALPHPHPPPPLEPAPKADHSSDHAVSLFKLKQQFRQITHRQSQHSPQGPRLNSRSQSCELQMTSQPQMDVNGEEGRQKEWKQRPLKSIKEYLKLAYKRIEKQRKRSGQDRLPEIRGPRVNEADEKKGLEKVETMRSILKKNASREREKIKGSQKNQKDWVLVDKLSGWDSTSHLDEF